MSAPPALTTACSWGGEGVHMHAARNVPGTLSIHVLVLKTGSWRQDGRVTCLCCGQSERRVQGQSLGSPALEGQRPILGQSKPLQAVSGGRSHEPPPVSVGRPEGACAGQRREPLTCRGSEQRSPLRTPGRRPHARRKGGGSGPHPAGSVCPCGEKKSPRESEWPTG